MTTTVSAVSSELDATGGWTSRDGRPGRYGVVFAAVWLVFLLDPLREAWHLAWTEGDRVAGWVGILATLVFAASYLSVFMWVRAARRRLQARVPLPQALLALGALSLLMLVMVLAIGQAGMAAIVYLTVVGVLCL